MPNTIGRADLAALKHAYPLAAVAAGRYGVAFRPSGRRLVARCPLPGHERDREPSFVVYPDQGRYHCFGCRRGDVIDLVAAVERVDLRAAIERLAGAAPPPLPERRPRRPVPRAPPSAPLAAADPALGAALALAVDLYAGRLADDAAARAYLAGRGVGEAMIRRWRLGLGGGLTEHLRRLRRPAAPFRRLGLLDRDGRERFTDRITVPELAAGRPTWLTGRLLPAAAALPPAERRYDSLPGPRALLGLGRLPPGQDRVVVVEGVFDLLLLDAWGYPAVALGGAGWTRAHAAALARFRAAWVLLDADEAGRRAAAELVAALGGRATPVALPAGAKDVGELAGWPDGRGRLAALLPTGLV